MLTKRFIVLTILLLGVFAFKGFSQATEECGPVTRAKLREMVVQLGYTVKDIETAPGKEKIAVTINRDGLDIPVGIEISPSGSYIWLTVNLGNPKNDTSKVHHALLKYNSKSQPCQFYYTESGRIMMGLPAENRGMTNAIMKLRIEMISKHVGESQHLWKNW